MSSFTTTGEATSRNSSFTNTHWSVVLAARQGASVDADAAIERLCRVYWRPLYAFVRRRGYQVDDAKDLTQEFFARLLEKDYLRSVDRGKGKFRSFLLAALEHFLAKEWRRAHAQKRGGRFAFISFNDEAAEQQYLEVPGSNLSAEQLFDQQWAVALLNQSLVNLQQEFAAAGKSAFFEQAKVFLTGEGRAACYPDLASKLGTTEAALKMAISRMRHRYGEVLRAEIAHTVADPGEVEQELRSLFGALSL